MKPRTVWVDASGGWKPGFHYWMRGDLPRDHPGPRTDCLVVEVGKYIWAGDLQTIEVVPVSELIVRNGMYFDPDTNLSVFPCADAEEIPL